MHACPRYRQWPGARCCFGRATGLGYGPGVRRAFALSLLITALAPGTWLRETPPPPDWSLTLRYQALALPGRDAMAGDLGAFSLAGAWRLESRNRLINGFSGLLWLPDGSFAGYTDRGLRFAFAPPPGGPGGSVPTTMTRTQTDTGRHAHNDSESVTATEQAAPVWIGWEGENRISRHDASGRLTGQVRPSAMRGWGANLGPEAMVRLSDGRFVALSEGFISWFGRSEHPALLFAGDPVEHPQARAFTFAGAPGFRPTDMAQLPDGRVLILMRRVVWPVPVRFAARLVIADPATIRPGQPWQGTVVARIGSMLPLDNFEGLAVGRRDDGRLDVWLISDGNNAALQDTVLWRLVVDPARLGAGPREKARGGAARPVNSHP